MSDSTLGLPRVPSIDLLSDLGARIGPFHGQERPLDFGDPAAEEEALATGCALLLRTWAERVDVGGADRQRFLHGLLTCEVKGLAPGQGAYGFFTDVAGKIRADVALRVHDELLALELPAGVWAAGLEEHVHRYRIADRVEPVRVTGLVVATLAGPGAGSALTGLGLELPAAPWSHATVSLGGVEAVLWNRHLDGEAVFDLEVPTIEAGRLAEVLAKVASPVGERAWEARRVEGLVPRFGVDYGPDHFPQETGLDEAVSFTKGCYLGQEVVARIHYRGKVNRAVRGLLFAGAAPALGTAVVDEEAKELGRVTSLATSRRLGRAIGLGLLHRRVGEPGSIVRLADGSTAEVVARF